MVIASLIHIDNWQIEIQTESMNQSIFLAVNQNRFVSMTSKSYTLNFGYKQKCRNYVIKEQTVELIDIISIFLDLYLKPLPLT